MKRLFNFLHEDTAVSESRSRRRSRCDSVSRSRRTRHVALSLSGGASGLVRQTVSWTKSQTGYLAALQQRQHFKEGM